MKVELGILASNYNYKKCPLNHCESISLGRYRERGYVNFAANYFFHSYSAHWQQLMTFWKNSTSVDCFARCIKKVYLSPWTLFSADFGLMKANQESLIFVFYDHRFALIICLRWSKFIKVLNILRPHKNKESEIKSLFYIERCLFQSVDA